ncbi:hypothetical protein BGZ63DRAFT_420538 [Mariannaea sp. PMI_226]|nr:hypothetical protein BGZ63DRAFT_420538 [Mariannaea sp. PMI_226]
MAYHYSPQPLLNGELDMPHPAYSSSAYNTPFPAPDIETAASNFEAQQHFLPDKKRNKLGYHRTTIACGHCRKRKIRCVPAQTDLQGRCVNCIRLKKECEFYPVDQPPPSEGRSTQLTKISPAPTGVPHPFPNAALNKNPVETPASHPFNPLVQSIPSSAATPTLKSDGTKSLPNDTKAPLPSLTETPFEFGGQPVATWVSPDANHSPSSKPADMNQNWRGYPSESPSDARFSPFGPTPASASWTPGSSETGSREDSSWASYPPPSRSMSYGGEPLAVPQAQFPSGHQQLDRRASALSDVYTSSMGVPVSGIEASVTSCVESTGPLSAGVVPPSPFGEWSEAPQAPSIPTYTYPAWGHGEDAMGQSGYPEPGPLADNESPQCAYFGTR